MTTPLAIICHINMSMAKLKSLSDYFNIKYAEEIPKTERSPFFGKEVKEKEPSIEMQDEWEPLNSSDFISDEPKKVKKNDDIPPTLDLKQKSDDEQDKLLMVIDYMAAYNFITHNYANTLKSKVLSGNKVIFYGAVRELLDVNFKLIEDQKKYSDALKHSVKLLFALQ